MSQGVPLVVFPYFRSNPFVTLTLLAAASAGFEIVPVKSLDELVDRLDGMNGPALLHAHWTAPVCQAAPTLDEAHAELDRFQRSVEEFRERGGRLVWTIHNAQPHEMRWPDLESSLVRFLAEVADLIHVMNPATAELMEPIVSLPSERIREIPHPSYVGIYPATRSRADMRSELGFSEDQLVVALIGELRRYKGAGTFLEALALVRDRSDDPPAVVLAGKVPETEIESLRAALPSGLDVVFHPTFIPASELGNWFRVADLCVLPYQRILNSGSAHLAATMGVPIAVPDEASLVRQFGDEPWVHFFDHRHPVDSLAELLLAPESYVRYDERAEEYCRVRSPWRISQRVLDELYRRVLTDASR